MTQNSADIDHATEDWMLVGVITAPLGVRGEVKIDLATDFPDRFKLLKRLYVGPKRVPMPLASARRHVGRTVLSFEGIGDRDAAETLRGLELYIPRSEALPLPDGQYYYDQIVGLRVVTTEGTELGRIEQILQTGSNDVYVVRDGTSEVLIPAIHDVVTEINIQTGTMLIQVMEGLL